MQIRSKFAESNKILFNAMNKYGKNYNIYLLMYFSANKKIDINYIFSDDFS